MSQDIETVETTPERPDKDARTWGMICHLMALCGYVIPFGHILGPLIIWAIKKDEHEFVNDQGREAINFQLTMTIAVIIAMILIIIVIGIPLLVVLMPAADLGAILANVERHEVSWLFLPPTLIYMLMNHPDCRTTDFSSLRFLMSAAAPFNV